MNFSKKLVRGRGAGFGYALSVYESFIKIGVLHREYVVSAFPYKQITTKIDPASLTKYQTHSKQLVSVQNRPFIIRVCTYRKLAYID